MPPACARAGADWPTAPAGPPRSTRPTAHWHGPVRRCARPPELRDPRQSGAGARSHPAARLRATRARCAGKPIATASSSISSAEPICGPCSVKSLACRMPNLLPASRVRGVAAFRAGLQAAWIGALRHAIHASQYPRTSPACHQQKRQPMRLCGQPDGMGLPFSAAASAAMVEFAHHGRGGRRGFGATGPGQSATTTRLRPPDFAR